MDVISARNCRICLSQCETRDLDISEFAGKYVHCTGYQITEKDTPKKICSSCTTELIIASNFQAKCQETETILLNLESKRMADFVKTEQEIEVEEIDIIEELQNHDTEEYEQQLQLSCDFCEYAVNSCKRIQTLKTHVEKCHKNHVKEMRCSECAIVFTVESLLHFHMKEYHGESSVKDHFSCTFCSLHTLRPESIVSHVLASHKDAETFACIICQKQLRTMDHLRWHFKHSKCANNILEDGDTSFECILNCDFCGFSCALEANMQHHVEKMHGDGEIEKCYCGSRNIYCKDLAKEYRKYKCNADKSCQGPTEYRKRKPTKEIEELKGLTAEQRKRLRQTELVECEFCHEQLKRASLQRHINNKHHGVKYLCQYCEKPYTLLYNLKVHIAKHHMNHQTEYPCQYCDRKFNAWASRYYHQIRVHTKNFKHSCTQCDKKFIHQAELEDHISTHTGVRTRECDECGEKFASRDSLKTHKETTHRTDPPVKCEICRKAFLRDKQLKKHLKQMHGTTINAAVKEETEVEEEVLDEYEEAERFLVEFIANQEMEHT